MPSAFDGYGPRERVATKIVCRHCGGRGYVPGDPEADPIEECQKCKGTGSEVVDL